MKAIELLLSDARGVYIPRDFMQSFDLSKWGLSEDASLIEKSLRYPYPICENYWDVWQSVLDNAFFEKDGYTWCLYQDGDLFAICDELMTDSEKLEFYGEDYD